MKCLLWSLAVVLLGLRRCPAEALTKKTLDGTTAAGFADEAALESRLPGCDFDNYSSTTEATRLNMRLCSSPATPQR